MRDEQRIRIETVSGGYPVRVWIEDTDGTEHELHNILKIDMNLDAASSYPQAGPVTITLTFAASLTIEAPLSVCDMDVVNRVLVHGGTVRDVYFSSDDDPETWYSIG